MPNVLREQWKAKIRAEIESLKNGTVPDDDFNEIFLGVLNAMAHFGFVFENVGTNEKEWTKLSDRFFGVARQ